MAKEQKNPDSKSSVIKNVEHQDHFRGGDDTIDFDYRDIDRQPNTYDQTILTGFNQMLTSFSRWYVFRSISQFMHANDSLYRSTRNWAMGREDGDIEEEEILTIAAVTKFGQTQI